jgi:cation:H+ antiporter
MSVMLYIVLLVTSIVVTLGGCALFTNAIEWLGKRLKVPEGVIGSVFAAVGTTLPETSIPIIAIFFGSGREREEVGLGAILGAPFMLSTLVLPILAGLLLVYARMGKRAPVFRLDYGEVRVDLQFFLIAYGLAVVCAFTLSRALHVTASVLMLVLYALYVKIKFSGKQAEAEAEAALEPLHFSRKSPLPAYGIIGVQALVGLAGLISGAHLFVTAAKDMAAELNVSPLLLALLIAPLATELPELSNSFLWLYQKKDNLAVGNVTGAMVFQGTFPVSVGLIGTDWVLEPSALATMGLAMAAAGMSFFQLRWGGYWRPWLLVCGMVLYVGFTLYLYTLV